MNESAAEKIVFDGDVAAAQVTALRTQGETIVNSVARARAQLPGTSFGALNTFLVGAMNGFAGRTAEVTAETANMANRMADGVAAAHTAFERHESDAVTELDNFGDES